MAVHSSARTWLVAWGRALVALGRATTRARSCPAAPLRSLGRRGRRRPARRGRLPLRRPGRPCLAASPGAVGAVDLDHADALSHQVLGEPVAVAAGAFYAGGGDLAVALGPGDQVAVGGVGGPNDAAASQRPSRSSRTATWTSLWGSIPRTSCGAWVIDELPGSVSKPGWRPTGGRRRTGHSRCSAAQRPIGSRRPTPGGPACAPTRGRQFKLRALVPVVARVRPTSRRARAASSTECHSESPPPGTACAG